jgi:O-antigen ligase
MISKSFALYKDEVKEALFWMIPSIIILAVLDCFLISDHSYIWVILTVVFSATILSFFNFDLAFSCMIFLSLMPPVYVLRIHPAVIFSSVVLISALLNLKGDLQAEVKNPLWKPLFFYFLATMPSFINSRSFILSLRDYSNLISLFIIFFVTLLGFYDTGRMKKVFYFFITAVFLHSIYVIILGLLTGRRAFGILGVYFIDYAGLASLVSFILMIYSKGIKKILFVVSFIFVTLGLILTQTRNAWISTAFAIGTLIIFLIKNHAKLFIKRKYLIIISVTLIVLTMLAVLGTGLSVGQRLDVSKQTVTLTNDPESVGMNSFVSRLLIWHTAVYAFLEHPIIGIGAYSFKHTSQFFYVIPKGFYKLFVEGRTPHITYLQVLTETGILGFIFFMIFIGSIIKFLYKTLKLDLSFEDNIVKLMTIWSLIYIVFSMMMTESWIYGPYIVWLGMLLGFMVNIYKNYNTSPLK